jgi:2-amino-4-hydroxy-6-hydroxymethyldihydropteridine diphosphokinase
LGKQETIFVGLGGNRASTEAALQQARRNLGDQFDDIQTSDLLTTEPHATDAEGPFLNQVVQFQKESANPRDLLEYLLALEEKIGRKRDQTPNRLIDLDLLYVGQQVVRLQDLRVPHPRVHRRPFVLRSMVELASQFAHPILRRTQRQLLDRMTDP